MIFKGGDGYVLTVLAVVNARRSEEKETKNGRQRGEGSRVRPCARPPATTKTVAEQRKALDEKSEW